MPLSDVNSIIYLEVKDDKAKETWMKLLEALLNDSLEDHFYKVVPSCFCDTEYILVIPDKYKSRFNAFMTVWVLAALKSAYESDRSKIPTNV